MTFQEAMAATSRELNARATITCVDAFVISNTPLVSFSIEEGGQMTLGSVVSSRYTVSLPNSSGEFLRNGSILGNRSLTGARVQLQIGVYHDGAWDWQNAGLFIVEKTNAVEFGTAMRLTGNDPLIMLDKFYDDQLAYRSTTTLGDILTHIKSKGITITGSLACNSSAIVNFQPDWGEEPTVREVLGYVLQMGGSFARCDRAGNITIAASNNATTHAVTTDKYMDFTDDERYFNFNRIKILPNGAKKDAAYVESYVTAAAESAANTICLEGNPLFRTKTTTSYYKTSDTSIKNVRYYVKIGNKYEVVPEPLETSLSLYYRASKSYNTTTLQTMANALKTALTGMSFRAITIRWRGDPTVLIGDKVTITDTRGVATTTVILQQSLRYENGFYSEIACPLDLTAVYPSTITSGGAWTPPYFGTGTIDGSVIMPDSLTGVHIADGSITNTAIKGGTITGTEIADSTITNSHFMNGTISGSIFEDGTIDGSKITDSTIENSHFVAGTIEGSSIKGGTIDGTHIYNGTADNLKITNASIQDGAITNAKIAAAGIDFANIKDVVAGTGIFRQGVGDALYLDRLVVNDANFASAIAGKLMIRDTDGKLYRISVNSSGAVTATQVQVNGDSLTDNAVMSVSQRLLWRQATQPSAPWVGMLWLDTTTEKLKRCTAITPSVAWEVVPAGEVHTAVIDVDDNGMNILTGGNLNLLAGGNLNIKNLGNTANVINMDSSGLTLSSTGQLKLQSTDSIIIGGSPFSVGGTNLWTNTDFENGFSEWFGNMGTENFYDAATTYGAPYVYKGKNLGMYIPASASGQGFDRSFSGLVVGEYYTISFNRYFSRAMTLSVDGATPPNTTIGISYSWGRASFTFKAGQSSGNVIISTSGVGNEAINCIDNVKLEKGTMATDWSPSPEDPASGVKTSYIDIATDHIDIGSSGNVSIAAGANFNVRAGAGKTNIGISNNAADNYFMWAGHGTPASAPFSVKMDGSVKATKIQHEMPYTFWDMADASVPAEFPIYIPSGYTIDSVTVTFKTNKARTFAKSASSGGGFTTPAGDWLTAGVKDSVSTGTPSANNTGSASPGVSGFSGGVSTGSAGDSAHTHNSGSYTVASHSHGPGDHTHTMGHQHSISAHTHQVDAHSHGLDYGINEKSALATSCVLKVGATTIGTYSPNPSAPVEIKANMAAGWNTITVAPNNDARIVAYAMVKVTPT